MKRGRKEVLGGGRARERWVLGRGRRKGGEMVLGGWMLEVVLLKVGEDANYDEWLDGQAMGSSMSMNLMRRYGRLVSMTVCSMQ